MGKVGISRRVYACEKHGEHEHYFSLMSHEGYDTNRWCLHCFNKFITKNIGTMNYVREETVEQEVNFEGE